TRSGRRSPYTARHETTWRSTTVSTSVMRAGLTNWALDTVGLLKGQGLGGSMYSTTPEFPELAPAWEHLRREPHYQSYRERTGPLGGCSPDRRYPRRHPGHDRPDSRLPRGRRDLRRGQRDHQTDRQGGRVHVLRFDPGPDRPGRERTPVLAHRCDRGAARHPVPDRRFLGCFLRRDRRRRGQLPDQYFPARRQEERVAPTGSLEDSTPTHRHPTEPGWCPGPAEWCGPGTGRFTFHAPTSTHEDGARPSGRRKLRPARLLRTGHRRTFP